MNKVLCTLLACVTLAGFAAVASAQTESALFFDVRNNSIDANTVTNYNALSQPVTMTGPYLNDSVNGGKRGAGQVLRLDAVHADGYHVNPVPVTGGGHCFPNLDGDANRATGDLWLYGDVFQDAGAIGVDDVISSIGIDFDLRPSSTPLRNTISTLAYTWMNDQTVFNSTLAPGGTGPWNGVTNGALVAGSPPDWTGAKAVAVPVTSGPVYATANRLVVNNGTGRPYRLGRLRVTAGTRACSGVIGAPDFNYVNRSRYNVFMKVNNLLITRVFSSATGSDVAEMVSFGYNGAALDAPVNGSSQNNESFVADAIVEVRMKGDWTADGRVTSADTGPQLLAASDATDNEMQAYLGDYTTQVSGATIGNLVTSADTTPFLASFAPSTTCP